MVKLFILGSFSRHCLYFFRGMHQETFWPQILTWLPSDTQTPWTLLRALEKGLRKGRLSNISWRCWCVWPWLASEQGRFMEADSEQGCRPNGDPLGRKEGPTTTSSQMMSSIRENPHQPFFKTALFGAIGATRKNTSQKPQPLLGWFPLPNITNSDIGPMRLLQFIQNYPETWPASGNIMKHLGKNQNLPRNTLPSFSSFAPSQNRHFVTVGIANLQRVPINLGVWVNSPGQELYK